MYKKLLIITIASLFSLKSNHLEINNTKKLKLLIVTNKYPLFTETFITNELRGLVELGHDVHIYSKIKNNNHFIDPETINLISKNKIYINEIPKNINSFDIIYCQFEHLVQSFCELKKNNKINCKLVVCFRGIDHSLSKSELDNIFYYADMIIPVSKNIQQDLIEKGCDGKKTTLNYSSIDCSKFKFKNTNNNNNNNKVKITSVARLVSKKGLSDSILAINEIVKSNMNIEYLIIGDGKEKQNLEDLIKKLNLNKYIKLIGSRNQNEIIEHLNASDIFILTSKKTHNGGIEGIPTVLMESMAIGIPVISTNVFGIPELIDNNETGFLIPENNISELTSCINHLIKNINLIENIKINARKKIEKKFNMTKQNKKLANILLKL